MKKILIKLLKYAVYISIPLIAVVITLDLFVLPWLVDAPTLKVPNVIGQNKEVAIKLLSDAKLNPIEEGYKFDERFNKDEVLFQKPASGTVVKENRRVYIWISGGEALIKMPELKGKSLRDAMLTVENYELSLGEVESVRSEFPADIIVDQDIEPGTDIQRGTEVNLKVSVGPRVGMVRVPNVLGKSLTQAKRILKRNSLEVGNLYYQVSNDLNPNTVISQIPGEDTIVKVGSTIDLTLIKLPSNR